MLEDSLPRISFAKPWNLETSVYTQSTTWLLSNMQSINCFIIVDKVLLCLTIKKFDVFDSGWYDCSKQNSASVQSICNWHCTKYCGTVSKDWRGDKLPAALVFTSSKIPKGPSAYELESYLMSFSKRKNLHLSVVHIL